MKVRAEDRLKQTNIDEREGEELASEIYVPLVHYADKRLLAFGGQELDQQIQSVDSSSSDGHHANGYASEPVSIISSRNVSTIKLETIVHQEVYLHSSNRAKLRCSKLVKQSEELIIAGSDQVYERRVRPLHHHQTHNQALDLE